MYRHNEYGKPLLANQEGIYFNVSHSGGWVSCGVRNLLIGIDVEGGKNAELQIAKRFFTKEEYAYLGNKDSCTQKDEFYNYGH